MSMTGSLPRRRRPRRRSARRPGYLGRREAPHLRRTPAGRRPTTPSSAWPRPAEAAGFDAFFRSDHFLTMGGDGLPGPTDAWLTLGAIARETERIRLGTLVTSATFRAPGLLAIAVAQVDAMTGGRVELGLGAGWYDAEHTAYGFEFPPLGERFERLEETFAILTGLWTTPAGRELQLRRPPLPPEGQPRPAQAGPAAAPAPHRGWRRAQAHAPAGRHLRRRVQPALLLAGRHRGAVRPGARRLRGPRPRSDDAAPLGGPGRLLRARRGRRSSAAAARIGREADELRANGAAGTPDEVVASASRPSPASAPRPCTSRCSTSHDLDHIDLLAEEVLPRVS